MKIRRLNPDTLNETKEYSRSKRTNRRRQKRTTWQKRLHFNFLKSIKRFLFMNRYQREFFFQSQKCQINVKDNNVLNHPYILQKTFIVFKLQNYILVKNDIYVNDDAFKVKWNITIKKPQYAIFIPEIEMFWRNLGKKFEINILF